MAQEDGSDHKKKRLNLTRAHCSALLEEAINRARQTKDSEFSYFVAQVVVFGSYLSKKERPGDLDVALYLVPRYGYGENTAQRTADLARRQERETNPRNIVDDLYWPQNEVYLYVKNRSTGISVHPVSDLMALCERYPATRFKIMYSDNAALAKDRSAREKQSLPRMGMTARPRSSV